MESDEMNIRDEYDKSVRNMDAIAKNIETRLIKLEEKKKAIDDLENMRRIRIEKNSSQLAERVRFNVGGKKFVTTKTTLLKYESFFSGFLDSEILPDEKGYYFIDRSPKLFAIVLDYLRDGILILDNKSKLEKELIFKEFEYYLIQLPDTLNTTKNSTVLPTWLFKGANVVISSSGLECSKTGGCSYTRCIAGVGWDTGIYTWHIRADLIGCYDTIGICDGASLRDGPLLVGLGTYPGFHRSQDQTGIRYYDSKMSNGTIVKCILNLSEWFFQVQVSGQDDVKIPLATRYEKGL